MPVKLPINYVHDIKAHNTAVRAVRFNRDGDYCLICGSDKTLKLLNPYTGVLLKTYNGHGYDVLDSDASDDSSRLISCGTDRTVIHWDVATGKILKKYREHLSRVNCCMFSELDCSVIISGSYDSTVRCWDTRSKSNDSIQVMDEAKDSISSIDVNDHEILAGSVDGFARTYDIRMGKLIEDCISEPITSVSFTSDQQCLLISTLDNNIRLIDRDTGACLNTYTGHQNTEFKVDSCLLTNDSHVVAGSEDGSVFIWDLLSAKISHQLKHVHDGVTFSLCIHPQGTCMITASTNSVKLWSTDDAGVKDVEQV